jgi:hypothetical protein
MSGEHLGWGNSVCLKVRNRVGYQDIDLGSVTNRIESRSGDGKCLAGMGRNYIRDIGEKRESRGGWRKDILFEVWTVPWLPNCSHCC